MSFELVLVDDAWRVVVDTQAILSAVDGRLVAAGAVTEHRQLLGLSAQEVAVLVERERGCSSGGPQVASVEVSA